jgi:hypothetical protein
LVRALPASFWRSACTIGARVLRYLRTRATGEPGIFIAQGYGRLPDRVQHQTTGVVPIVANLTVGRLVLADMLVSEQAVVRHGHRLPPWQPSGQTLSLPSQSGRLPLCGTKVAGHPSGNLAINLISRNADCRGCRSVDPALDALAKAGVKTLGSGTTTGSDPFGILMIDDPDVDKALAALRRASIHARLG